MPDENLPGQITLPDGTTVPVTWVKYTEYPYEDLATGDTLIGTVHIPVFSVEYATINNISHAIEQVYGDIKADLVKHGIVDFGVASKLSAYLGIKGSLMIQYGMTEADINSHMVLGNYVKDWANEVGSGVMMSPDLMKQKVDKAGQIWTTIPSLSYLSRMGFDIHKELQGIDAERYTTAQGILWTMEHWGENILKEGYNDNYEQKMQAALASGIGQLDARAAINYIYGLPEDRRGALYASVIGNLPMPYDEITGFMPGEEGIANFLKDEGNLAYFEDALFRTIATAQGAADTSLAFQPIVFNKALAENLSPELDVTLAQGITAPVTRTTFTDIPGMKAGQAMGLFAAEGLKLPEVTVTKDEFTHKPKDKLGAGFGITGRGQPDVPEVKTPEEKEWERLVARSRKPIRIAKI